MNAPYRIAFLFALMLSFGMASHASAAEPRLHASNNWAGYELTDGTYTGVRATWTVPESKATNSKLSADAAWIGIGGNEEDDLIQAGTQTLFQGKKPSYQAWYEILPDVQRVIPLAIEPGDTVSVSLKEIAPNIWHLSFTNVTTGMTYQLDIPYVSSKSSAEWIVERPLAILDDREEYLSLSDFDTVRFTNTVAIQGGKEVLLKEDMPEEIVLIRNRTSLIATPSDIASDGSFAVSYLTTSEGRAALRKYRRAYQEALAAPAHHEIPVQMTTSTSGTYVIKLSK